MRTRKEKKHSERSLTKREAAGSIRDVYPSMSALSGDLKIPLALLKRAKREGCKGFEESARVHVRPVLEWIFSRDDSSTNWQEYGRKFDALIKEVRYQQTSGAVVEREAVESGATAIMLTMFSELDRLFTMEMPPLLKGLTEIKVREKSEAAIAKLKTTLATQFEKLGKGKE